MIPGDLVIIEQNKDIPADCLLIKGELTMEEGMLTGEVIFKIYFNKSVYL